MRIEADEFRIGKSLGHQNGRSSITATHVGDFSALLQFRFHPIESRYPRADQVGVIVGPKESLRSFEERLVMISPGQSLAGAKSFGDFGLVFEHGRYGVKDARDESRAVFDG